MFKEYPLSPIDRRPICKCGKVGFDKKGVQTKRNFMLNLGKQKYLRIYQCNMSNYWHLTKREDLYGKEY